MKVAAIQLDIIKNDKIKNLEKVNSLIGDNSLDLVVLPELFSTGYFYENISDIMALAEEIPQGFTTNKLLEIAKEKNTTIIGTILEKENGKLYICSVVLSPNGFLGKYRKKHLTNDEKNIYNRGENSFVFEVNDVKIGIIICFEGWLPERARELTKQGVQIILHSALICNPKSLEIMSIRALENNCYIAVSNACSTEFFDNKYITFRGESRIFGLNGDVLVSANNEESIIISDLNTDLNKFKTLPDSNDLMKEIEFYK